MTSGTVTSGHPVTSFILAGVKDTIWLHPASHEMS